MKLKIAIMSLLTSILMSAASVDYLSNNSASYFQNPSQTGNSISGRWNVFKHKYAKFLNRRINDLKRKKI